MTRPLPGRYKPARGVRGSCVTGKMRYSNRAYALESLGKLSRRNDPGHTENRAYRCPDCAGWHLTSK